MIERASVLTVLLNAVPEFRPVYEEHVRDNDVVLDHLLFGDVRRFTLHAYERGETEVVERVLTVLDRLMAEGDEETQDLVAVSFIEDIEYGDPRADAGFIARWGAHLREERERQRRWRPDPSRQSKVRRLGLGPRVMP